MRVVEDATGEVEEVVDRVLSLLVVLGDDEHADFDHQAEADEGVVVLLDGVVEDVVVEVSVAVERREGLLDEQVEGVVAEGGQLGVEEGLDGGLEEPQSLVDRGRPALVLHAQDGVVRLLHGSSAA